MAQVVNRTSRLVRITRAYRAKLAAQEREAVHALSQAHDTIWRGLQPHVERLRLNMADALASGEELKPSWAFQEQRLKTLQAAFSQGGYNFSALARIQVQHLRTWAVQAGQQQALDLLNALVPKGISFAFGVPSPAALAELTGRFQAGSPVVQLFDGWGEDAAAAAKQALLSGLAMGQNPAQVARMLRDAAQLPLKRARVLAQDQMVNSYRQAALETYRANSDVVGKWMWSADLGSACAACTAMNGQTFDVDQDMDSHVGCRCAAIPVTNAWSDILGPLGADIPDTTVALQSGQDWFDDQDEATQQQVLGGKAIYNAYAAGDIPDLQSLVGVRSNATWGRSVYQKSMSELGLDPSDYS
jgi:SPP1 gp7 family putative phage head morphogenesis protein